MVNDDGRERAIRGTDPFNVERNTLGQTNFGIILAHEFGHALGLRHSVLKSDAAYPNQSHGDYSPPNLMAPEPDKDSTDVTQDQCDELMKGAKKFEKKK